MSDKQKEHQKKLAMDNKYIDLVFSTHFFQRKIDRQLAYLVGRYYSEATYCQKKILRTNSLIKRLPRFTKRIDRDNLITMVDQCNNVLQKIASKRRSSYVPEGDLRGRINELLKKLENIESSFQELGVAFQMGYDSALAKRNSKQEMNEGE